MYVVFITHQHAAHAERDIDLSVLSVCPSDAVTVSLSHFFDGLVGASF